MIFTSTEFCQTFYYWTFASQYLKTSALLPSYVRNKFVLLKIYEEKRNSEYQLESLSVSFLKRHEKFDSIISKEKLRIKKVNRWFIFIDLVAAVCILGGYVYFRFMLDLNEREPSVVRNYSIFVFFIEVLTCSMLAISAFQIAKSM